MPLLQALIAWRIYEEAVTWDHAKAYNAVQTYSGYETINECMEGVCKIYEDHSKRTSPNIPSITYNVSQLCDFINQLADLSCLVYQKSTNTYAPYNKDKTGDTDY